MGNLDFGTHPYLQALLSQIGKADVRMYKYQLSLGPP